MMDLLVGTLVSGSIYSSVALGLVLIHRGTGVLNFAHGEAVTVGAFTAYVLIQMLGIGWIVALPIVFLVGALLGLGAERGLIVRLRNASELEIVVATLALAVVLRGLLRWEFGSEAYSIPPIGSDRGMEVLGLRLTAQQMITIGFGVFVAVACWFILTRTKLGLRIRVSSADRDIASLLGIRTDRIFASVWMVSLGSAALAGAIVAPQIFVSPDMGFTPLLFGVVGAVVGGFGSFVGAVVGSYFIAFVAAFASYLGASHWQDSSVFVLLAVVLLVRPDGIFGRPTAERV